MSLLLYWYRANDDDHVSFSLELNYESFLKIMLTTVSLISPVKCVCRLLVEFKENVLEHLPRVF